MPLLETDYCLEQINVPPKLPTILKQFCKSAIRTQPYDLLKWSSAYFHALANSREPPTKLRLEFPPSSNAHGLTLGFLKVLFRQLGADYNKFIPLESILCLWEQLCLDKRDSDLVLRIGKFRENCQTKKFLVIALGLLTRCITETMILVCELFTFEPEGGSAMIPHNLFMNIYEYLADLRCDGAAKKRDDSICICALRKESSTEPEDVVEPKPKPKARIEFEEVSASESGELKPEQVEEHRHEGPGIGFVQVSAVGDETDLEPEVDFEYVSKSDIQSKISLESFGEEMLGSSHQDGEMSYRSYPASEVIEAQPGERPDEEISSSEMQSTKEMESQSSFDSSKKSIEEGPPSSLESSDMYSHYPDVPGIGRVLLPEEVAAVAVWMMECSRRQEGLVGPRNIRHVNCPPLTGFCFTASSSGSSLTTDSCTYNFTQEC